jgi:hypothetical protein
LFQKLIVEKANLFPMGVRLFEKRLYSQWIYNQEKSEFIPNGFRE